MSNNVWDEKVTASGAGIAEGTYVVTLKDIERENKVVQNRSGFAGKKIIGKQYDSLDADQKSLVDSTGDEYWPPRGTEEPRKKIAFMDQYRFIFTEPKSGMDLRFGATFDINRYDAAFNRIGGGKALTDFITRATGVPINPGDEFKLGDFFKPGDEFVVTVVSRNNFKEIDANSIIKKELAKPIVTGIEALSDGAKEMLDWLKGNMTGRPKRDIADIYGSGQFGTYAETQSKWQEIMKNVPYTKDGKTLDFSEA